MKIRWSKEAESDVEAIFEFISRDKLEAAIRTERRIYEAAPILEMFPELGRSGRLSGTREFRVSGLPYVIVYRVVDDVIDLRNVVHFAQSWPR